MTRTTQTVRINGAFANVDVPDAPPQDFRSYQILAPPATHFRTVSCEDVGCIYGSPGPKLCGDVGCVHYLHGWVSKIDESTELGQRQAYYIRNQAGRRYTEERHGPLTDFTFEAGQRCFATHECPTGGVHRVRLERPEIFVVRDGDWRASTNRRVHASVNDWLDDFLNHQNKIADLRQKG